MTEEKQKKSALSMEIELGGISDTDIMLFTKHLSVVLKSGVALIEGLEMLEDQSKGKMRKICTDIRSKVSAGDSFYAALSEHKKYFSPIYLNMIHSGEQSGTLQENLERLSMELKNSISLRKKVKSAMLYPMMVFIAVFGLGMSVAIFVLPKILPLFATLDVELPVTTRGLIFVAEVFQNYGLGILVGTVVFFVFLFWLLKRDFVKPISHRIILVIPVINTIVKNINLERFNRTLGTMLETGLTVDKSLAITGEAIENRAYRKAILSIIPKVESGDTLSASFSAYPRLFPPITVKMIGVGEKTGNLAGTLKYLSGYYQDEVDEAVKNLSVIIEPVLLIIIGVIVGTVAISILGPIYKITGSLNG